MKRPIVGRKASAARRICRREKPRNKSERDAHSMPSTVKVFTVAHDGGALSRHDHRDELWVVLGVHGQVGDEVLSPQPGQKLDIPRETVHKQPMRILGIFFGEFEEGAGARHAGEEAGCG